MKSHPILYSAPMARANVEKRKTQTRRIVDFLLVDGEGQSADPDRAWIDKSYQKPEFGNIPCLKLPYGPASGDLSTVQREFPKWQVGDHLWGKETFARIHPSLLQSLDPDPDSPLWQIAYRADGDPANWESYGMNWTPSIFMPRSASRIHQEILSIRCERVQAITEEDSIAEGVKRYNDLLWDGYQTEKGNTRSVKACYSARESYQSLWNSINLKPAPVYQRNPGTGKKEIVSYLSYPWSLEDFSTIYPGVAASGTHRDKPITILPNPWVWVIGYKNLKS